MAYDVARSRVVLFGGLSNNGWKGDTWEWNGSTWTDSRQIATGLEKEEREFFDIAWEGSGKEALICWGLNESTLLHYTRWEVGAPLSSCVVYEGPDFLEEPRAIQAQTLPGKSEILVLCNNHAKDLRAVLWDGDAFVESTGVLLDDDLKVEFETGFGVCVSW